MKNILGVLIFMLSSMTVFSQSDSLNVLSKDIEKCSTGVIYIRKDALPPNVLEQLSEATTSMRHVEDVMSTVEAFQGSIDPREIGAAIDTLSTIFTNQSNRLASSRVGKFVLVLVGWKVFGSSLASLSLKIPFVCMLLFMFIQAWYMIFVRRKYVIKSTVTGWWKFSKTNVLEEVTFDNPDDMYNKNEDNTSKTSDGKEADNDYHFWSKVLFVIFLLLGMMIALWA